MPLSRLSALFRFRLGGLFSLADEPTLPVTGDRHPLRRGAARRLILSCVVAVGVGFLAAGAWLILSRLDYARDGAEHVRLPARNFRPGLRGPVMIMGEIAARSGTDAVTQEGPRAGGAPQVESKPDPDVVGRSVGLPVDPAVDAARTGATALAGAESGDGAGGPGAVEMLAPAQVNPCFILKRMIRPFYPTNATDDQRRLATVRVEAAFYVDVTGAVTASYIIDSEGGPLFDQAVLDAVNAWLFEPANDPQCEPLGFWVRLPVVFRSPQGLGLR